MWAAPWGTAPCVPGEGLGCQNKNPNIDVILVSYTMGKGLISVFLPWEVDIFGPSCSQKQPYLSILRARLPDLAHFPHCFSHGKWAIFGNLYKSKLTHFLRHQPVRKFLFLFFFLWQGKIMPVRICWPENIVSVAQRNNIVMCLVWPSTICALQCYIPSYQCCVDL